MSDLCVRTTVIALNSRITFISLYLFGFSWEWVKFHAVDLNYMVTHS